MTTKIKNDINTTYFQDIQRLGDEGGRPVPEMVGVLGGQRVMCFEFCGAFHLAIVNESGATLFLHRECQSHSARDFLNGLPIRLKPMTENTVLESHSWKCSARTCRDCPTKCMHVDMLNHLLRFMRTPEKFGAFGRLRASREYAS